jgi:twitching motility protein PilT
VNVNIGSLLDELVERGGSALHLGGGYPPLARIRGELVALRDAPIAHEELEGPLLELLAPSQRARLEAELELDFAYAHGPAARLRASYFTKSSGLGAVFRVVPSRALTLAQIGCPEVVSRLAERRSGLVLVAGPTGAGKSTTLAAMLDHVNETRACHILTIEDPIEVVHEPRRAQITQRAVGIDASSFAAALRNARHEDADVVLVSELATAETTMLALQLAGEGALVLAAVVANGAARAIDRLLRGCADEAQAHARSMLAETLVGVVAQQLVPSAAGSAQVAVHDILLGSAAVSTMIRDGETARLREVMQGGQAHGMQTLDMALGRLVAQGTVAAADALDRAVDRESLALVIARVRPDLVTSLTT